MNDDTPMTDTELLVLARTMRGANDTAGLLYLNAVLTIALYRVTGRSHILPGLRISGEEDGA